MTVEQLIKELGRFKPNQEVITDVWPFQPVTKVYEKNGQVMLHDDPQYEDRGDTK